jgi:hypothetical protein
VRGLYLAVPTIVVAALLAPAVAQADALDDYVNRKGNSVCAELDKADSGGDIFRLALTVARDGGFTVKQAANVIGRSAAAYCPWNQSKLN